MATGAWLVLDFAGRILAILADRHRALLDQGRREKAKWWRWIILPLCVAVVVSVQTHHWPLQVRFRLSQPAFDEAIVQLQNGANPRALRKRTGLFSVLYIHQYKDGATFFQTGNSGWDKAGVVHCPNGKARGQNSKRLGGKWFTEVW
ncbi:MAG: hypothetical protein GY842_07400 [bacterium]|nr:hypothetical protein [bacterium]